MAKRNGGIIGPANTPTASVAAGVWRLRDAFNSIKNGTWPLTRGVATNSLRFNIGSSDYLSRTMSSTGSSRTTFTFSTWIKLCELTSNNVIFSSGDSSSFFRVFVGTTSRIGIEDFNSVSYNINWSTPTTGILLRDPSAWYHLVVAIDTTQATASNRVKIYLNGSDISSNFTQSNSPSQNAQLQVNNNNTMYFGYSVYQTLYFGGYQSEVHFVNGQQLDATSFGASNSSGVWYPIAYQGTWGTNGFYLKFANSASLGTDSSGNNNTWTVNNLTSVDQSTDTELNNFCTINPLDVAPSQTFTDGNLTCSYGATNVSNRSTFALDTGKWYWEMKVTSITGGGILTGITDSTQSLSTWVGATTYSYGYYSTNGQKYNNGSGSAYGNSYTNNDIIGIAFDATNGKIYFSKNGTFQNSGNPATDTNPAFTGLTGRLFFPATSGYSGDAISYNFGNPSYSANGYTDAAGYGNFSYAVPSGYYALCTANLNTYG
jgi:hypothetical protein